MLLLRCFACFVGFTPLAQSLYPREMDSRSQFAADHATAGTFSMDGSMATLEFVANSQRLWGDFASYALGVASTALP
jgi:hypothetical protein